MKVSAEFMQSAAEVSLGDQLHLEFLNTFRTLLAEEAIQNALLKGSLHSLPDNLD